MCIKPGGRAPSPPRTAPPADPVIRRREFGEPARWWVGMRDLAAGDRRHCGMPASGGGPSVLACENRTRWGGGACLCSPAAHLRQ